MIKINPDKSKINGYEAENDNLGGQAEFSDVKGLLQCDLAEGFIDIFTLWVTTPFAKRRRVEPNWERRKKKG